MSISPVLHNTLQNTAGWRSHAFLCSFNIHLCHASLDVVTCVLWVWWPVLVTHHKSVPEAACPPWQPDGGWDSTDWCCYRPHQASVPRLTASWQKTKTPGKQSITPFIPLGHFRIGTNTEGAPCAATMWVASEMQKFFCTQYGKHGGSKYTGSTLNGKTKQNKTGMNHYKANKLTLQ